MPSHPIFAAFLLLPTAAAAAEPGDARPSFEERVVAILNAGGSIDTMQGRLNRVEGDAGLSTDQRLAIDAMRTLVRTRGRPNGLSLAEAESFAARNPGSTASALLIAEAALADHQPLRSADALIAAVPRAGALVQLISPSIVSKLSDELDSLSDRKRTADLGKALLYAGWGRGSASLRSYLALAAIRDEIAANRPEQARQFLSVIGSPASLHEILIDNRLAPLRPEVERRAGARLEQAWSSYLSKSRAEWLSRGDALSATGYAEALKQANQYDALSAAFMARFMRGYNCPTDLVARTIAADLYESLVKLGRWARAEDVMRRAGGISPPIYAAMLLERGEFGRAAAILDRSLQAADAPKDKTGEKALAWLRAASACAAFRSGKRSASVAYDPMLLDVSARLNLLLCIDKPAEAHTALLSALGDEGERADALRWVQPFADPIELSAFRFEMNGRIRALQRDPAVIEAVSRVGVILDWPLAGAVPPAPTGAGAGSPAWQCGDDSGFDDRMPNPESIRLPDSQP